MIPSAELPIGNQRIIETSSLPLILGQLDLAMRTRNSKPGRHRRGRQQRANQRQPTIHEEGDESPARPAVGARKNRKGKRRADDDTPVARSAWFLDVANPTWADLRAIGKVLHIHPLTLEDILQQDPREKLEIFAKLGYYFISFRSVESRETAAKVKKLQRETAIAAGFPEEKEKEGDRESDGLNGVGEANVYLAVFKDGICCVRLVVSLEGRDILTTKQFHFTDVSGMFKASTKACPN
jgi:magnesium transporter